MVIVRPIRLLNGIGSRGYTFYVVAISRLIVR